MAKWVRIHKRKKIGVEKKAKEKEKKVVKRAVEQVSEPEVGEGASIKGEGTRYSCLHSTVRKKAGTTYSPKYSPKH